MKDEFPDIWVKRDMIDSLINLVNSKQKCKCFLSHLSSFSSDHSANVGGYDTAMIQSFKENQRLSFGLYACLKSEFAQAQELVSWWEKDMHK